MYRVKIHIEELLIKGMDTLDPAAVEQALCRTLGERIAAHGIPDGWHSATSVSVLEATYPTGQADGERIGRQTAEMLYGGEHQ